MRTGAAALTLVAAVLGFDGTDASARPVGPPPLAFRSAMLNRPSHTIDVHMQAMTEVPVEITLSRAGRRIGDRFGAVHSGQTVIPVQIGPRTLRRLRPGLHVDVRIIYGGPEPLRVRGAILLRAPDFSV